MTTMRLQYLNNDRSVRIYEQKTQNWRSFLTTLNHKTGTSKLYKTIKSITQSNTGITTSHAAIGASNSIPTYKAQTNILIDHYANIRLIKPLQSDRHIIWCRLPYPIDHTLTPFSPQNTKHVINDIKNSPATGPNSISNFHLKHLGPQGIQAHTNIINYIYAHCLIPKIWKQGRIITVLKPNKDPTTPSSYRPITQLCTTSKITEHIMLNIIHPDVTIAPTQHGFRPLHSTNTLLTNLTQHVLDGINSKRPGERTLLTTIHISKAFDAIPRHRLTDKLYNTNMHNKTKRWLANYI